jgi:hypothetical protein
MPAPNFYPLQLLGLGFVAWPASPESHTAFAHFDALKYFA